MKPMSYNAYSNAKEQFNVRLLTSKQEVQNAFGDLVNNYSLFHEKYSSTDFLNSKLFPTWEDDSNYSNVQHIDDFLKTVTEKDFGLTHTLAVPISYAFSSEETKGGCDRPYWVKDKGDSQCRTNLNEENQEGNPKGYRMSDAQTLSAMLRPHPTILGTYILVKFIGNNRVWMKLLANKGKDSLVKMEVTFHEEGLTQKDYIAIEAESHSTDAGNRSSQNESQKFASNYRAGRKDAVHLFKFLKKHQINFGTIMQQEGEVGSKNWLTISSIQGIKEGEGNGFFGKYGEQNVDFAISTIKEIAKTTKEKSFGNTPVQALAMMFYCYTQHGLYETHNGLFTKPVFKKFLVEFFKEKNKKSDSWMDDSQSLLLSEINQTGGVKNIAYINTTIFWPAIVSYYKHINKNKNGFSVDAHCNRVLLKFCKDRFLAKEARRNIT